MNSLVPSSYLVRYSIIKPVKLRVMSVTGLLAEQTSRCTCMLGHYAGLQSCGYVKMIEPDNA